MTSCVISPNLNVRLAVAGVMYHGLFSSDQEEVVAAANAQGDELDVTAQLPTAAVVSTVLPDAPSKDTVATASSDVLPSATASVPSAAQPIVSTKVQSLVSVLTPPVC